MSVTSIVSKAGTPQVAQDSKTVETIKSYQAKPWDKWSWEEMCAAVLTAQGHEERKNEVADHAGRTLRAAFRGYANKKFSELDLDYIQATLDFERKFTLSKRPKVEKKAEAKKEATPPPPPKGDMVKA